MRRGLLSLIAALSVPVVLMMPLPKKRSFRVSTWPVSGLTVEKVMLKKPLAPAPASTVPVSETTETSPPS